MKTCTKKLAAKNVKVQYLTNRNDTDLSPNTKWNSKNDIHYIIQNLITNRGGGGERGVIFVHLL